MLLIHCPFCGARDEAEFFCDGEFAARPDPARADDAAWSDYLVRRDNARDWIVEHWVHAFGCEQWLAVTRHSVTNEVRAVRPVRADLPGDGS